MPNLGYLLLHGTWLVALCLWVGGLSFVTFIAAPLTFRTLPTRAAAGALVGSMLRRFDRWVAVCLVVMAASGGARHALFENPVTPVVIRYLVFSLMALFALLGMLVVSPRVRAIRESLGRPIDEVPADDPGRRAFGAWHGISMLLALGQLLAGAVLLYLA